MIIPRSVFALARLCDCEVSRFALDCVEFSRIDPEWCRAVVTDGKYLVVVEWEDNRNYDPEFGEMATMRFPGFTVLIPSVTCDTLRSLGKPKPLAKVAPKFDVVVLQETVECEGDFRAVAFSGKGRFEYSSATGKGKFPKWREIVEEHKPHYSATSIATVLLNLDRLARVASVLAEAIPSDEQEASLLLLPNKAELPIAITRMVLAEQSPSECAMRAIALLVPMLESDQSNSPFHWWPEKAAKPPELAISHESDSIASANVIVSQGIT